MQELLRGCIILISISSLICINVDRKKQIYMKKITIFAFIGLVFIGGVVFVPQAKAEVVGSGSEISPAEAKILKQTLDVIGLVLKDIEAKIARNELSGEKKIVISKALSSLGSSLSAVNLYMAGGNGSAGNYPGTGSLYSQEANNISVSEEALGSGNQTESDNQAKKGALASLWATVWPRKLIGIVLLLAAVALAVFGSRKEKQLTT